MNTNQFLDRVLASDGRYCLWLYNRASERMQQHFYDTTADMTKAAAGFDASGWDVYFALAVFGEEDKRTADNAIRMRSFFLDLDCGEEKEFPSQTAALQALQVFCKTMNLPKPMLVSSGRGIHAYWVMDRDLTLLEWLPIATKLKAACKQHNFPADPAVPADAARVLRVPETRNHKDSPPSPVTLLAQAGRDTVEFDVFAEAFKGVIAAVPRRSMGTQKMDAIGQLLLGNSKNSFKKILTRRDGCAQLTEIVTNQADASEPQWRGALSIAVFCEDADKAIHAVSKNHPDYDPDVTERKADTIKGPYLCSRFDELEPGVCESCPHFNKIKSPIVLGKELRTAETDEERTVDVPKPKEAKAAIEKITVPRYPDPYVRGATGGVYKRGFDDDGDPEDVLVYHHDIYVTRRVYDPDQGESVIIRLHLPKDGLREFSVPQAAVGSRDKVREALMSKGVTARGKRMDLLGEYIMDYVDHLQATEEADLARNQFGWTDDFKSFVLGDREIFADRTRHNPPTDDTGKLARAMDPKGTLEEWQEMMRFFNHKGMELHQLVICTAFGSPLMAFSSQNAMLLHIEGPTGFGKTTVQWAAAGVYGKPDALMVRHKDTAASKYNRFQTMKNLPIYVDELTKCSPEEASALAYDLSDGSQRNRMSSGSNAERSRGDPWYLSAVSSGNASVMQMLDSSKADASPEKERVFEVNVKEYIYDTPKTVSDEMQRKIRHDVYGVAGEVYIKWLVRNQDQAKQLYNKTKERFDTMTKLPNKGRFVSSSMAAYLTGGLIAQKIGLIDFDMHRVFDLCVKLTKERLAMFDDDKRNAIDYLNDYINENWNNTLIIDSSQDLRATKKTPLENEFVVPDASPRMKYIARYEKDIKKLYLIKTPFRSWCNEQQIMVKKLMESLAKEGMEVEERKVRLGKGTHLDMPPAVAYVIDMDLSKLVPEAMADVA